MAILLIDGFDYATTSAPIVTRGWTVVNGAIATTTGRFGGNSLTSSGANNLVASKLVTSSATLVAGFGFFTTTVSSGLTIAAFGATSNTGQIVVSTNASNILQVKNSGGTTIATGTTVISPSAWNFIELKGFQSGASGTCEVHLNGAAEIASTVGNFGSTNFDRIVLGSASTSVFRWDDVYVLDTTGPAPRNTFLGDVRVAMVLPSGAGAHTQWQANGAASNYQCVDEAPPNDDTDYVSDANPGDIDTYAFADIDGGASVFGVQTSLWARKDDANTRQIAPVIRQGGTDYAGTTVTLGSTYGYFTQIYNQDPTAADWTAANVNADEFGVKEIA